MSALGQRMGVNLHYLFGDSAALGVEV
jgi:hypothetical protein